MKSLTVLLALIVATACSASTDTADTAVESSPSPEAVESAEVAGASSADASGTSTPASEPAAAAGPVKSGAFAAAEHPTTGTAQIIQEGDQRYVELGDDFSTDPGPDLFVVLHQANDFFSIASPPAYGIEEGSYASIAPLEQVSGAQRYLIPDSVDVDEYGSVAIWCRQFNATFGAANLAQ
ncbi:MAG: DM13 domain-containing protein [Elainellaceae cyanobacterium]